MTGRVRGLNILPYPPLLALLFSPQDQRNLILELLTQKNFIRASTDPHIALCMGPTPRSEFCREVNHVQLKSIFYKKGATIRYLQKLFLLTPTDRKDNFCKFRATMKFLAPFL